MLEAGGVRLMPSAREATVNGNAVTLTTVEYDILEFLIHAAGRAVSRDELSVALYRRRSNAIRPEPRRAHQQPAEEAGAARALIRTVRSVGYMFSAGTGSVPGW